MQARFHWTLVGLVLLVVVPVLVLVAQALQAAAGALQ